MQWGVATAYTTPLFLSLNNSVRTVIISTTLIFYLIHLPIAVRASSFSTCSPYFYSISIDQYSQNEYIRPCPISAPCQCICESKTKHLWIDCFNRRLKSFPTLNEIWTNHTRIEWNLDLAFNDFENNFNLNNTKWLPKNIHIRHMVLSGSIAYDLILQLQLTYRHLVDDWPSKGHFSVINDVNNRDMSNEQPIDNDQRTINDDDSEKYEEMRLLSDLTLKLRNETKRLKSFTLILAGEPGPISNLYLDHNSLDAVPIIALYNATTLQEIYLSFNQIVDLPAYTFGFSHRLTRIDLSNNKIRSIDATAFQRHPSAFAGPFLVDYLDLSHNRLTILESNVFSYLVNLRLLKLEHNQIYSITAHVWTGLYRLKFLDLSHNYLESFDQVFYSGYLNELTHLKVTSNNLNQLNACEFLPLKALTILNLNGNNLTSIDNCAFHGLHRLSTRNTPLNVYIRANSLERIEPCTFHEFGRSTIHIDNNPLICNCSFNYLLYERQSLAYTGRECRGGFDYPLQYQPSLPAVRKKDENQRKRLLNLSRTCQDYYQYYNDMCSQLNCGFVCAPQETLVIQVTTIATPSQGNLLFHRRSSAFYLFLLISILLLTNANHLFIFVTL